MSTSLVLQELGIVVAMQQLNPTLITEEFLKLSGVIPTDWQLARQPIHNERVSQLFFTNEVSIVTESNRIIFGESIGSKQIDTLSIATVAQNYINVFKQANFQAVGINLRSYSHQPSQLAASEYINHQLLSKGSWQNYGTAPIQAALNVIYTLENRQLTLSVNAAEIQESEQSATPIILFSGNFNYNLSALNTRSNLAVVGGILADWQQDLSVYRELISERFLGGDQPEHDNSTPVQILEAAFVKENCSNNLDELEIGYVPDHQLLVVAAVKINGTATESN